MSDFVYGIGTTVGIAGFGVFVWDYLRVRRAAMAGAAAHNYLVQVQAQSQAKIAEAQNAVPPGPKVVPMPPRKDA